MFTVRKEFSFEAAHYLPSLPDGHKCRRMHGHSYRVQVELATDLLDEHGMVADFAVLDGFSEWLKASLDHRVLNDAMPWAPTSERLAWWLSEVVAEHLGDAHACANLVGVGVSETPKTWAWWRP